MTRSEEKELAKTLMDNKTRLKLVNHKDNLCYEIVSSKLWLSKGGKEDEVILLVYPKDENGHSIEDKDGCPARYYKDRSDPRANWDGSWTDNRSFDEVLKEIEQAIDNNRVHIERDEEWVDDD